MSANNLKGKSASAPVVVLHECPSQARRQFLRLVPASCFSILVHAVLLFLFFLLCSSGPADALVEPSRNETSVQADQPDDMRKPSFSTTDFDPAALEPDFDMSSAANRLADVVVPGEANPSEQLGVKGGLKNSPLVATNIPGGFGGVGTGGPIESLTGPSNVKTIGDPGGYNERGAPLLPGSINGRGGAAKEFSLRTGGGTDKSEAAVTAGIKWLIRQQLPDGRWMLNSPNLQLKDHGTESNDVAATALGLLPLLAAGKTHQPAAGNPYDKNIDKALKFLIRSQDKAGYFGGGMYAHGLATIALCEAYGLTQDPRLRRPAQLAINLIVSTQHETGGWRYGPAKTEQGDLSVSGWQIMALKSGQMAGLMVPNITIERTKRFVARSCNADDGYSYTPGAGSTPTMTAVGLLCRQYMESWGPSHPQMIKAIRTQIRPNPPDRTDVYNYYYATQVMHHFGGESWRDWNEKMRETLIRKQESNDKHVNFGSWSAEGDQWGRVGGRLMMTSLNLLTLEVYYRYLPLYQRDAGYKMDEAVKKAS